MCCPSKICIQFKPIHSARQEGTNRGKTVKFGTAKTILAAPTKPLHRSTEILNRSPKEKKKQTKNNNVALVTNQHDIHLNLAPQQQYAIGWRNLLWQRNIQPAEEKKWISSLMWPWELAWYQEFYFMINSPDQEFLFQSDPQQPSQLLDQSLPMLH